MAKTKIGVIALIIGAFVAGGLALNALKSDAFWGLRGGAEISEEMKAEMQERRQAMEELRDSNEWQEADVEQRREMMQEIAGDSNFPGPHMGRGLGFPRLFKCFGEETNQDIVILNNGIQITITSDNPDIIERLHNIAEKVNSLEQ